MDIRAEIQRMLDAAIEAEKQALVNIGQAIGAQEALRQVLKLLVDAADGAPAPVIAEMPIAELQQRIQRASENGDPVDLGSNGGKP